MNRTEDTALEGAVRLEQLRVLYSGQKLAVSSGLVLALILVSFLSEVISLQATSSWFLTLILIGILRLWDASLFLRGAIEVNEGNHWLIRFRLGVYATAMVWASACIFLFPEHDIWHQTFIGFALAGLGISVAIGYAVDLHSAIPFFTAATIPFMLRMFLPLEAFAISMGFATVLFLTVVYSSMWRIHHYLIENIKLRLDSARRNTVLLSSEQRFRQMFERPVTPMMLIDKTSNRIVAANEAAAKFYQYSVEQLQEMSPQDIEMSWVGLNSEQDIGSHVCRHRLHDQSYRDVEIYVSALSVDGRDLYFAIIHDITERKRVEAEVFQLAFYDALTGLPNRRLIQDRLQSAIKHSCVEHDRGCLIYLDLDHFKSINDIQGHELGDRLLIEVARRMMDSVGYAGMVGRLGGDEFVVLLQGLGPHAHEASVKAAVIAEKVREVLSQPYFFESSIPSQTSLMLAHYSSSSMGVSFFGDALIPAAELLKQAEMAMYQAKGDGRNMIRYFDPSMQQALEDHALLSAELRDALLNDHFELYFQMQVDSAGLPIGAEALLRWKHPERAVVGPEKFIGHIEESGLIVPVGNWVMQYACQRLKEWQAHESSRCRVLAVNVSAKQFHQNDFVERVTTIVAESGIDSNYLKLELTESAVIGDIHDTISKMERLRALGLRFSLDDFGTGHSSLKYLKHLPLDQLKIDQSFVRDLTTDANDAAIVDAVIGMAQALQLEVIAEGVETEAQRDILLAKGCKYFQGFLFSKPQPVKTFEASWLR
ncbi:MAG: EAL domain-containing protein [Gallionella sp.]|nr:EAL domain-containing protein [Gallionella sp.]